MICVVEDFTCVQKLACGSGSLGPFSDARITGTLPPTIVDASANTTGGPLPR
jgi:hypothetical protein